MSLLSPGVFQLLSNATGTGAGTLAVFSVVMEDFGIQTTGTGTGYVIQIEGSNDASNWFTLTTIYGPGYTTLLHMPCAYVQAVVTTAPTSGSVSCVIAGK